MMFLEPYYNKPEYISALAQSIRPFIESGYDKLVFSFHSLPIAHQWIAALAENLNTMMVWLPT
ncbi:MAG: ferrochelatase, partial [Cyanobacteriota bacterium]